MSVHSAIYVSNTTIIKHTLTDRDDVAITTATVTLESLTDKQTGDAVSGVTVPLTLTHTAGGVYEGTIPSAAGVVAGRVYKAVVKAVSGSLTGQWTETVIAQDRAQ